MKQEQEKENSQKNDNNLHKKGAKINYLAEVDGRASKFAENAENPKGFDKI